MLTMLTERFSQALVFAQDLHRHQVRKGSKIPYISHLLIVTGLVLESGCDEDTAIAALLHDAVEDQGGDLTLHLIRAGFGHHVADLVAEVSDTDVSPKPPWRERKEHYLARVRTMSPEALLIAIADKLANARTTLKDYQRLGDAVWTRFNAGKADQAWFNIRFLEEAAAHQAALEELLIELRQVDNALFDLDLGPKP